VSQSEEEADEQRRALSDTGLVEIRLDEFAERIRDVKRIVAVRLRELMDFNTGIRERDSAAYSLGTLRELELKLQANPAKPPHSSSKK
jgi:hypothetical protein